MSQGITGGPVGYVAPLITTGLSSQGSTAVLPTYVSSGVQQPETVSAWHCKDRCGASLKFSIPVIARLLPIRCEACDDRHFLIEYILQHAGLVTDPGPPIAEFRFWSCGVTPLYAWSSKDGMWRQVY